MENQEENEEEEEAVPSQLQIDHQFAINNYIPLFNHFVKNPITCKHMQIREFEVSHRARRHGDLWPGR